MSVSGIFSSLASYLPRTSDAQKTSQQFRQDFRELGRDLQSGNLSAAAADLGTLEKLEPQSAAGTLAANGTPITRALAQLTQDVQSGNLPKAQQDYRKIELDLHHLDKVHRSHHHERGDPASGPTNLATPALLRQAYSSTLAPVVAAPQFGPGSISVKG